MGRKKIKIEPIQGERSRTATFLKRKTGLFKKAHELAILTESDVAVMIFNRQGKLSEFCSSNMEEFLLRYSDYSGPIERRGTEHFANASELSTETDRSTTIPSPWTECSQSNDAMQMTPDDFQQRRFSSDSRSSIDHSPHTLPFNGPFPMSEPSRGTDGSSSIAIPSNKFSHAHPYLDIAGSSMSSDDTAVHPSSAPDWHQAFQGTRGIQPSITRMANGRMVSGMPTSTISNGRRWSSGYELELTSQLPQFSSSLDERRMSTTTVPYESNPSSMHDENWLHHSRAMHPAVEPSSFGSDRHMSLGSSYPLPNSALNMHTFTHVSDLHTRRPSVSMHSPQSHVHTPISPTVSTSHTYQGNPSYSDSMVSPSSPETMNVLHVKLPMVPGDSTFPTPSSG